MYLNELCLYSRRYIGNGNVEINALYPLNYRALLVKDANKYEHLFLQVTLNGFVSGNERCIIVNQH